MNVLEQIAGQVAKSDAQKRAAMDAMQRLQELTLREDRGDGEPLVEHAGVAVDTDFVFFVVNGRDSSGADAVHMRKTVRAYAEQGSVTVVTTGRMGVEIEAAKLAKALELKHIEIATVWQRPNADGTTTRMPSARNTRNRSLRRLAEACVAEGRKVGVLVYGTEQSADAVEELLVKAGARPRPSSKYFRKPEPVVAPEAAPTTTVMVAPGAES